MDISFMERFTNVINITDALVANGNNSLEARDEAKRLEDEIFRTVTSHAEYQMRCGNLINGRKESLPSSEAEGALDPVEEILNPEGPTFGNYECATFHQDGQTSTVFKARAKDPAAVVPIVALKVMFPAAMQAPHDAEREARILRQGRSQHVVPLLEAFRETGGRFILAFPFLRQDLENLLRSGTITSEQKNLTFSGLFGALDYLHSHGIIHRDVKPSNVLLKSMHGPVFLADFGIAWSASDVGSEPADSKITDVGTTRYRPPELLFGYHSYDTSLDMWAAGCVVAEMVRENHSPLFDAGPLGSELGLIKSIFTTLGTPNNQTWPSARSYPDWGKMRFQDFPAQAWETILPGGGSTAIDFVRKTVCYEPSKRLSADQALRHPLRSEISGKRSDIL